MSVQNKGKTVNHLNQPDQPDQPDQVLEKQKAEYQAPCIRDFSAAFYTQGGKDKLQESNVSGFFS